jgi:hypothetical protein
VLFRVVWTIIQYLAGGLNDDSNFNETGEGTLRLNLNTR